MLTPARLPVYCFLCNVVSLCLGLYVLVVTFTVVPRRCGPCDKEKWPSVLAGVMMYIHDCTCDWAVGHSNLVSGQGISPETWHVSLAIIAHACRVAWGRGCVHNWRRCIPLCTIMGAITLCNPAQSSLICRQDIKLAHLLHNWQLCSCSSSMYTSMYMYMCSCAKCVHVHACVCACACVCVCIKGVCRIFKTTYSVCD